MRRKLHKRHIRNIQKSKGSYYVTIPRDIMRTFKWQERQKVEVKAFGKNKLIIEDWEK